ncbi:sugar-binding protein [Planctomycetota bacterium]
MERCWPVRQAVPRLILLLAATLPSAGADPALITPTPREMKLAGPPIAIHGGRILLAGPEPKLRVGADEINRRLVHELRCTALPVARGGLDDIGRVASPVFVLGVVGTGAMAGIQRRYPVDVPRKPQGYGIAAHPVGGKLVMVLAGHDEQGALYAAVTVRHLLDPAGGATIPNGRAVVRPARVRDWPDFRWRQIGRPPTTLGRGWDLNRASRRKSADIEAIGARFVREGKQYVDFLLRHKVNLSWTHAVHLETGGDGQHRFVREVSDYARARGVDFVEKTHSHIGVYPQDKDDPRKSRCVDHRVHRHYFCWSLLDLHKARARRLARAMKASGIRWLYLHATDGGGWENPARWNERCDECRRIYGDDHAKADAAVFGAWHRIMREEIADFRLIAVIYPYTANAIDPASIEQRLVARSGAIPNGKALAKEIADRNRALLTRIGQLLPPGVFICQREVHREAYALMTQCYGTRGFQIYLEQKHGRGWNPEFSIASGWLKTFYRPGHQDVFYPSDCSWGYNYFSEMMSAQFGWNVESPGAREFTNPGLRSSDIDHHVEPREISRACVERFCRDFYGPEVGPRMVAVYDSNISYRFIQRPQALIASMGLQHPEERMRQMVAATARAWESLQQARRVYDAARAANREPISSPLAAGMLGEMFRAILVSRCLAPYQLRMLEARAAAIGGEMDKAKRLAAEMREIVSQGKSAWAACRPWMKSVPIAVRRNPRFVYTFGQFHDYDYPVLEEEVARFEKEMDKLFEAHNVPSWFPKALRARVLYAVPASAPPVIDGRLGEPCWQNAPPNEFFVNHKTSTPAEKETQVRVLYDKTGLYLAYTVWEPGADQIPTARKDRDEWNPSHSVELFLDGNRDGETYTHYIWGMDGSILDARRARDGRGVLRLDTKGFTSTMRSAVARYPDRWTLEAWVPAVEQGTAPKPGAAWRANFCRNLVRSDGTREAASMVLMEGASFHSPSKFADLRFLPAVPPPRKPTIRFAVETRKAGPCTIGDGTGYELELGLALDTTKPLHRASLKASAYSGNEQKGAFTVFERRNVQLLWRSRQPVRHVVRTPQAGLFVDFRLEADEGAWTFHRRFGAPQPRTFPARFVEGISGKALAGTAHFPPAVGSRQLLDSRQGTVEMWVHATPPLTTALRFGPEPQHVLFCQGPVRHDHPLLDNTRSVCLRRVGRRLTGRVSTREYQQVSARAAADSWDRPGWHHVAMQWSALEDGKLAIEVYLDGKKASGAVSTTLHGKAWRKRTEPLLVQLGSMVTGAGALGWPIDEVRVSSALRYKGDFVPAKRAALDALATVVFHFDGSLLGELRGAQRMAARAGTGL